MAEVKSITTLEAIDDDIRSAIADRDVAFRKLMVRDDDANRAAFKKARKAVDSLLELRHGLTH